MSSLRLIGILALLAVTLYALWRLSQWLGFSGCVGLLIIGGIYVGLCAGLAGDGP